VRSCAWPRRCAWPSGDGNLIMRLFRVLGPFNKLRRLRCSPLRKGQHEGHARQDQTTLRVADGLNQPICQSAPASSRPPRVAEQKVSLIRIDWKGDIVCVVGASGYSANPFRVKWQLETHENPGQRNEYCRSIITQKIEATIITLEKSIPRSDKWERAMKSAYAALSRLEENPPEIISGLRALEANCAASYFRSWVEMPIKWRGTSRRPIPDNWHSIGQRSSPYHLASNRNAAHPVNAILNYAYAALEAKIRIKAISEGYDPTIGIMHEGRDPSGSDQPTMTNSWRFRAFAFRQRPRFPGA
jgi:hypothetical protein